MNMHTINAAVKVHNTFMALSVADETEEASDLNREISMREVNGLEETAKQKTVKLKRAGHGKITVDSGAAENVMPKDMVPEEPLVPSEGSKKGTRYIAAGGQELKN